MPRGVIVLLASIFLGALSGASANTALVAKAEEFEASGDIVGLAIAIVRNGEVETVRTFGVRDLKSGAPVDPSTVFRIASLSKGFTATLAAQLAEQGDLSLDEPISQYAPDLRLKAGGEKRATLADALSHRVGLPPYAYDNLLEAGVDPAAIRGKLGEVDGICAVGACYAYQNVTFDAARFAIEAKEGAPFNEVVERRLFGPLGMERASIGFDAFASDPARAVSYRRKKDTPWTEQPLKPAYYKVPAAGGVNASVADMAAWLAAQLGGAPDIVGAGAMAQMRDPRIATPSERRMKTLQHQLRGAWYGLGWRIYDYGGHRVINHSGSVEGYSAQIAFIPERNVGVVLLTNSGSRQFFQLLPAFLDEELGLAGPEAGE